MITVPSDTVVSARDLSLWYGDFQALDQVTLDVQQGEILSLIGPSGCGKSTFLRCLNRMNDASGVRIEGQLQVSGFDLQSPDTNVLAVRRAVGMVFQRPNPLPLSIRENVLFGVRLHAPETPRDRQDDLLEDALRTVGLWTQVKDKLGGRAELLSLESRQKLCIARLLPLKPRVLLMDEPCSALDPAGIQAIEELMATMRGQFTQVVVTHNMQQARRIGERCVFMLLGRIVEVAPTQTLFEAPRDERTARYIEGRFG